MNYIMANPPFNASEWWSEALANDPRWKYGIPPAGNANYAWLQHMLYHHAPGGRMALLLAYGSMSSQNNSESDIRRALIEAGLNAALRVFNLQQNRRHGSRACAVALRRAGWWSRSTNTRVSKVGGVRLEPV